MNTQYTAGPWHVMNSHKIGFKDIAHQREDVGTDWIAEVPVYVGNEANARLIAAAPLLLEACKASLQYLEEQIEQQGGCDHSVGICACPEIRLADLVQQAISKAINP